MGDTQYIKDMLEFQDKQLEQLIWQVTGRSTGVTLIVGAERFTNGVFLYNTRNCGLIGLGATKPSWNSTWATRRTAIGL